MMARISIVNGEHGIASCQKGDIPLYILRRCKAENVNIFYLHQRDWLVLNEGNPNFENLKEITLLYLESDDEVRKTICDEALERGINFFKFLNEVIRIRRKMHSKIKAA